MRIVIDKDYQDIQLLNEAYEKKLPTYKVLAVESDGEKFVYGKGLLLNEVSNALESLAEDGAFKGCKAEVVECSFDGKSSKTVWASDEKTVVEESTIIGEGKGWDAFVAKMKKIGAGIATLFADNPITKYFKDKITEWKKNNYITNDNELTGLGYKIATG